MAIDPMLVTTAQSPERVPNVLPHSIQGGSRSHVPHLFLRQRDAPEFAPRGMLGIAQQNAGLDSLFGRELEMQFQFAIEVVILGLPPPPEPEVAR